MRNLAMHSIKFTRGDIHYFFFHGRIHGMYDFTIAEYSLADGNSGVYIQDQIQKNGTLFYHKSEDLGGFPLWSFDTRAYFAKPQCAKYADKLDPYGRICGNNYGEFW